MSDYQSLPGFEGVLLEESIVRAVVATPQGLTVMLDAYLATTHPRWHPPVEGEWATWVPSVLTFEGVSDLTWRGGDRPPSRNADGTVDFDTLDVFTVDGDRYTLESGAGDIELTATNVMLTLQPAEDGS